MTLLYKLTNQDGSTRNGVQWEPGITQKAKPGKVALCSETVLHAYRDKLLAVLLNPIHANITNPRMFEVEGEIAAEDWGKVGCVDMTCLREIELPVFTINQRVAFSIYCGLEVYKSPSWVAWAEKWLSGQDRSSSAATDAADAAADAAAYAAADAAYAAAAAAAATAAAYAADDAAAYAAYAAADAAAYAAADAADAAAAATAAAYAADDAAAYAAYAAAYAAADAAAYAAYAATAAAYAAAAAAAAAARNATGINFAELAVKAYNFERDENEMREK